MNTSSFVFRPGGRSFDNVYADWEDLMRRVVATPGLNSIVSDGSHVAGNVHIPAGIWDVHDCRITSSTEVDGFDDVITFDDGAVLVFRTLSIENVFLHSDSSHPVIEFSGGRGGVLSAIFAQIESGPGKAPFIHIAADAGACTILGIHELSLGDTTTPTLQVDGAVELQLSNHSIVFAHALSGAGEIAIEFDADVQYIEPQAATTVHKFLQATAPLVKYVPAVPANWAGTSPSTVQEALDRIAAKAGPIA